MNVENLIKHVAKYSSKVKELRRKIHQNPELGNKEFCTQNLVCQELDKLKIKYTTHIGSTEVCAIIEGARPGKVLGIRADMDALPIQEKTGLHFESKNKGIMHACGHDVHTAILLGTAMVLADLKNELAGTVKLFFQPAEETTGGAKSMIENGCLENPKVDEVYALHVHSGLKAGMIVTAPGVASAFCDDFTVEITGSKSHASEPNLGIDAMYISTLAIQSVYGVMTRRRDPMDLMAINIGTIKGGNAANVVCDSVIFEGTMRSFNDNERLRLQDEISSAVTGVAHAFGGYAKVQFFHGYPCVMNSSKCVDIIHDAASFVLGAENANYMPQGKPALGSEDFGYFTQDVPGAIFALGIAGNGLGERPLHSSEFTVDEKCIETGMLVETAIVLKSMGLL